MDRGGTPLFRSLYPVSVRDPGTSVTDETREGSPPGLGVYLHVPFCRVKCPYCAFVVYTGREHIRDDYVEAMVTQLEREAGGTDARAAGVSRGADGRLPVRSIYLGGGTPTALPVDRLTRLLDAVRLHFDVADGAEITVETEPGTTSAEVFEGLVAAGVNRVTIGVQSFSQEHLATLGRPHGVDAAHEAVAHARQAGVGSLDLDLMFGYPGQDPADWHADLDAALAHRPEHLSLYNLTVEPGTPYATRAKAGDLPLPAEDTQAEMMRAALGRCAEAGLAHYEISNFARPGHTSRHNASYWNRRPYLGIGVGAHGFLPFGGAHGHGKRWWSVRSPARYVAAVREGGTPEDEAEDLDREAAIIEAAYLGLRQRAGLDRGAFEDRFGPRPLAGAAGEIRRLVESGAICEDGDRLALTDNGVIIADYAISRIVGSLDTFWGFDTVDSC